MNYDSANWYVSTYGDTTNKYCLLDDLKMLLLALHRVMRDMYLYEDDAFFSCTNLSILNKSLDDAATNTLKAIEDVSESVSEDYKYRI